MKNQDMGSVQNPKTNFSLSPYEFLWLKLL